MKPKAIRKTCVGLAIVPIAFSVPASGSGFRDSNWVATVNEVMQAEEAELIETKEIANGRSALLYEEEILGQTAEIAYVFDETCERLIAGSIRFPEPLSELQYLNIIKTFTDIYGEGPPTQDVNGALFFKWRSDDSEVRFMHIMPGIEVPELAHLPPSLISYWYLDVETVTCDAGED